jgi:hypothetical protein
MVTGDFLHTVCIKIQLTLSASIECIYVFGVLKPFHCCGRTFEDCYLSARQFCVMNPHMLKGHRLCMHDKGA